MVCSNCGYDADIVEKNEVRAYGKGLRTERKRILDLIKTWELTNFGSSSARFEAMQDLKDALSDDEE